MVYFMNKTPEANEMIVKDGRITEKFRRFVSQISGLIEGNDSLSPTLNKFDNVTSANQSLKFPYDGQTAIINNIICHYDKSAGFWRKADGSAA
jgi:hypothetical protein